MNVDIRSQKLIVADLPQAEQFYCDLGLKLIGRATVGSGKVHQDQVYLSPTGDSSSQVLIIARFLEVPAPPRQVFPGESWRQLRVADVDTACAAVVKGQGAIVMPAEDSPGDNIRAAVVSDPEGHFIELLGPMAND